MILMQIAVNDKIKITLAKIGTSPTPKKVHLKPEIRYTIGFISAKSCQNGGSMSIV
jgi:hypothetical protein